MDKPTSELTHNGHVRWNVALERAVYYAETAHDSVDFEHVLAYSQLAQAYALIAQVMIPSD